MMRRFLLALAAHAAGALSLRAAGRQRSAARRAPPLAAEAEGGAAPNPKRARLGAALVGVGSSAAPRPGV